LKGRLHGKNDAPVVIKADRSIALNTAVRVMDVAKAAGAGRLVLATEKEF
jgi:biopolymer transport protein ExbD